MIKHKKKFLFFGILAILLYVSLFSINGYKIAKAETMSDKEPTELQEIVTPRLFTTLNLGIGSKDGRIYGSVTNTFTLGFSTVRVYIELYSSYTYQESYTTMTFESRNYIADLDIGESIETSASTGSETKYWLARTRYRINSGDWEEKVTSLWLFDGDGNVIS